jgi:cytochrome P450
MAQNAATSVQAPPSLGRLQRLPPVLVYQMRCRPLAFLSRVAEQHAIAYLGRVKDPLYFISDPELVKALLLDTRHFVKGDLFRKLELIIGRGLITSNGDEWRDARRRLQPIFGRGVLPGQQAIVIRHTLTTIERLRSAARHGAVNLDRAMNELTFRIALELFVGAGDDAVQNMEELQWAIDTLNAYARWLIWAVTPPSWNTRRNREFRKAIGLLDSLVERIINERSTEHGAKNEERCDVLSLLRSAGFEGKALRDHVMTMLIAGHETTGTALSFLWAHLARAPEFQDSLEQESRAQAPQEVDVDGEALPLAEAAWREILRLYPSVPVLDRFAVEDSEIGGYRIPKGANVLWSPFVMHRSARYWPGRHDLDAFDPQAFLDCPAPEAGAYIPFGEGPRMCIGKSLADMEALTIISLFVRAFRVEPVDNSPVRMRTLVTLRPYDGVPVRLTARVRPANASQMDVVACAT